MAKIIVAGDAIVITTELKYGDILRLEKYNPDALVLKDEDGAPYFRVSVGDHGTVNKYGATFVGEARDGSGKATTTVLIGDEFSTDEIKEAVADLFGAGLGYLKEVEESAPKALEAVEKSREEVMASIEIA